MKKHLAPANRSQLYTFLGFVLGITAPVGWTLVHLVLFPDANLSFWMQLVTDITRSPYNIALYLYMGLGTAIVLASFGFFIGKSGDQLHERASELDRLNQEVAYQKEIFENKYKVLDKNIKNFHQIGSRIQRSINIDEVLALCAEGLHDILGYERVNILMTDENRKSLHFVAATGSDTFNKSGVTLPLDNRSGVIYKCFAEKKLFLIDDISKYPTEYLLQSPYDTIHPLRSRSFVICPIVVKGESIGLFGIDNKMSQRALNDTDVDTVKLFADQASSAITRINLLKSIDLLTLELGKTFAGLLKNRESYSRNVYSLKSAADSLTDNTANIASASESVLSSVDDTSASIGQISVATDQITRNLNSLSEAVYKSVSTMEEINASLREVERNTIVSNDLSRQVKEHSDQNRAVVFETIASLAEIQTSVDLSYEGVKRLSENTSRIDSIVNVINDITKRTNLLALNASIIAAQAGENGKSFGVVADEIRNLSLQTGMSTGEITAIIEEIMSESRAAAVNVTATKELVAKGVKLGKVTGEALSMIVDSSQQAMAMTEHIKVATVEQVTSVNLVTQAIEDISTMTSQIFKASKEQASAAKSIARAIDSIQDMTQEMVSATGRQVEDGKEIRKSVEAVSQMVVGIFDDVEKRQQDSSDVVKELEVMKAIAN